LKRGEDAEFLGTAAEGLPARSRLLFGREAAVLFFGKLFGLQQLGFVGLRPERDELVREDVGDGFGLSRLRARRRDRDDVGFSGGRDAHHVGDFFGGQPVDMFRGPFGDDLEAHQLLVGRGFAGRVGGRGGDRVPEQAFGKAGVPEQQRSRGGVLLLLQQ